MSTPALRIFPVVLAAVLVLGTFEPATAGKPRADVVSSTWDTTGKLKARVTVRRQTSRLGAGGGAVLEFGPSARLEADEFLLCVDDGEIDFEIPGTYEVDEKGKATLLPDMAVAEDELTSAFRKAVGIVGASAQLDIELKKVKVKSNAREKPDGDRNKVKFSSRFNIFITSGDKTVKAKTSMSYRGKGGRAF